MLPSSGTASPPTGHSVRPAGVRGTPNARRETETPQKTHPASTSASRIDGATANFSSQSSAVDRDRSGRRRSVVLEFDLGAHGGAVEQEALKGGRERPRQPPGPDGPTP